jgi:hypothetical protein
MRNAARRGRDIELTFTTRSGGLVLHQAVTRAVATAALAVGLDPTGLGIHGGRSTAITALCGEEGVDLGDVARHVGHSSSASTATYIRHLGRRPRATATAAGRLLDPTVARPGESNGTRAPVTPGVCRVWCVSGLACRRVEAPHCCRQRTWTGIGTRLRGCQGGGSAWADRVSHVGRRRKRALIEEWRVRWTR